MKKIDIIVKNCFECPYCEYDPHYDCSIDSGFDCKLGNFRIIDDFEYDKLTNDQIETFFHKNCPLPEATEEDIKKKFNIETIKWER